MESGSQRKLFVCQTIRKASRVEGEPRKKEESKLETENDEPSSISTTANAQAEVGTETEIGSEVKIGTVTEIGDPAMDESEQEEEPNLVGPEDETEVDPEKKEKRKRKRGKAKTKKRLPYNFSNYTTKGIRKRIYSPTKEAEDRLKAIRLAISAKGEDVLPDFVSWSEYKKEDDGYPCLIVPYAKKVVEAIDETQLDPLPQVPFV
jgi:hypothetical protein